MYNMSKNVLDAHATIIKKTFIALDAYLRKKKGLK